MPVRRFPHCCPEMLPRTLFPCFCDIQAERTLCLQTEVPSDCLHSAVRLLQSPRWCATPLAANGSFEACHVRDVECLADGRGVGLHGTQDQERVMAAFGPGTGPLPRTATIQNGKHPARLSFDVELDPSLAFPQCDMGAPFSIYGKHMREHACNSPS